MLLQKFLLASKGNIISLVADALFTCFQYIKKIILKSCCLFVRHSPGPVCTVYLIYLNLSNLLEIFRYLKAASCLLSTHSHTQHVQFGVQCCGQEELRIQRPQYKTKIQSKPGILKQTTHWLTIFVLLRIWAQAMISNPKEDAFVDLRLICVLAYK